MKFTWIEQEKLRIRYKGVFCKIANSCHEEGRDQDKPEGQEGRGTKEAQSTPSADFSQFEGSDRAELTAAISLAALAGADV